RPPVRARHLYSLLSRPLRRPPPHLDRHPFPTRRSSDLSIGSDSRWASSWVETAGVAKLCISAANTLFPLCEEPRTVSTEPSAVLDRKSTRLNSSHVSTSYAVFCLKDKRVILCRRRAHPH